MKRYAIGLAIVAVFACVPGFLWVVAYGLGQIYQDFGMFAFILSCGFTSGAALSVAALLDTANSQRIRPPDAR